MEKEQLNILMVDSLTADHTLLQDSFDAAQISARLTFATSTEDALLRSSSEKFDLVLTEHQLPEVNGFQLLFELRQNNPHLPILFVTNDDQARLVREAFKRGADDYILKEELEEIGLIDIIGTLIEEKRQEAELETKENKLKEQAERDGLTGLYNHRYLQEAVDREYARARRYRRPFSMILLDLDGFKAINDTCGHHHGDQLLLQISHLLLQTVRFVDIVARYGGDEFVILLPETDIRQAAKLAERILREIRKNPYLHEEKVFSLSASIGLSCYHSGISSAHSMVKLADQAMYEAKKKGRGRIVLNEICIQEKTQNTPAPRTTLKPIINTQTPLALSNAEAVDEWH